MSKSVFSLNFNYDKCCRTTHLLYCNIITPLEIQLGTERTFTKLPNKQEYRYNHFSPVDFFFYITLNLIPSIRSQNIEKKLKLEATCPVANPQLASTSAKLRPKAHPLSLPVPHTTPHAGFQPSATCL